MSSHSAASLYLAGMLALGSGIGAWLKPDLKVSISLTAVLLVFLACALKSILHRVYWPLTGLVIAGIGMWSMAATLPENQPGHYLNQIHPEVRWLEIRVLETLKPGQFSEKYTGEIHRVDTLTTHGKVLVEIRKDSARAALKPGQLILTPALPRPIAPPMNPGAFDYGQYLKTQGIYARVKLTSANCILMPPSPDTREDLFGALRQKLQAALGALGLGNEESQIARALLLGDRTAIAPELRLAYTRAGILHVLAISGLHVGILATMLFAFLAPLRPLRYGKGLQALLGLTLLWGYALIAGFSPSVVRAVLLYSFVALAVYLERPGQTLHFLGLCWVFMLAGINPNWLVQIGFQLSFAAVAAIVIFYPFLFRYLSLKKRPLDYFGKLIAVSLAAQIGTLPLTLYYFHQFPGLFLLSNLVLLPGLGVLLVTGLACLTLEVFMELPQAASALLNGLLKTMNQYVEWASSQEVFFFEGLSMTRLECILSVLAVFLFGIYLKTRMPNIIYGIAVLLLLFQGTGVYREVQRSKTESWVIPHQVAHTMIWTRRASRLEVACTDTIKGAYLVSGVQKYWGVRHTEYKPLASLYTMGKRSMRVLDRIGLYSPEESHPHFLLLSGSPRVHLGRVLQILKPKAVIADGSNYPSDLKRWNKSCSEKGIPFHATAYEGAFEMEVPLE
ncbi:MAG: ComEC/Rec2 family competence protein [Robiginitalea sp.]|uniref:ComEC/Rec2 family competence protein n=1 Tax=Robiginitalea sp. TaxID=1902411 RepID=UPI003C76BEBD